MLKVSVEAHTHPGQIDLKDSSKRLLCSQMKLFFNSPGQNQNKQEFPIHFLSGESPVLYLATKAKALPLSCLHNFTQYKNTKLACISLLNFS